jgi:HK97 family phage prohead protease
MLHKTFDLLETKTAGDTGEFEALVSVFGNVDAVKDRIHAGAYTDTLNEWSAKADPFPVILAHQWNDVMAHVGYANPPDVKQVPEGLLVKGKLDIEDNPIARQVHKLMKRRTLKQFSIGYSIPQGGERRGKDGVNEITRIDLVEFGPCLKGINDATELRAVKSALDVEPDPETLRKESEQRERQRAEEKIPKLPPQPAESPVEPLKAEIAALRQELLDVKKQVETPDPAALREESERRERELVEGKAAEIPEQPKAPEADMAKELQEVKDRLAQTEQALADLSKKAEETDKNQPPAGPVDPLRKRSEELALEVSSDGMSLRTPPKKVEEKPEPVDYDALKRQSHDFMFEVLSYVTETANE